MNNRKIAISFLTFADFDKMEIWLHNQHKNGWKLLRRLLPCVFLFERCTPENVTYRLDYKNNEETSNYVQVLRDNGWEYFYRRAGWLCFCKPISGTGCQQDSENFFDNASRIDMINCMIKTRLFPASILWFFYTLLCGIMCMVFGDYFSMMLAAFWSVIAPIFLFQIIYISLKLRKLKKKYRNH